MDISRYYFPFEGEKHLLTCILLPFREDTWREHSLPALEEYFNVIKAISKHEKVLVIYSKKVNKQYLEKLKQLNNVILKNIEYNDAWARDNLPVFLKDDEDNLLGVDFGFNAWGGSYNGLYSNYQEDNSIGQKLLKELNIPRIAYKDFILEGGSIHSNGKGKLLTTKECLLSLGRNPMLNRNQITERLKKALNVNQVDYLTYGIYNDETSGHVDNIACFLDEDTILLSTCLDKNDPQYERSLLDEKELIDYGYKVIKVPVPSNMYLSKTEEDGLIKNSLSIDRKQGRRLAGSYVNFYMSDKFIILPKFNVEEDRIAYSILNDFYKGKKEIIQIYSKEILLGGGNIHCITKQIPYSKKYKI